jgi:quercetin dioxygenase-like cupin family protein
MFITTYDFNFHIMEKISTLCIITACLLITLSTSSVFGQKVRSHCTVSSNSTIDKTWVEIINKALTDSGHVNKGFRMIEYTLAPGHNDTISHRHGAEIFIYVVKGSFEYRLRKENPILLTEGQVIHEPPYSLHTLTRNPSTTDSTKLLLNVVYNNGSPFYIREYPEQK